MLTLAQAKAALAAAERILAERRAAIGRIRGLLFDKQLTFIDDASQFKAALCSRRAGKSVADGAYLFQEAYAHPGTLCLFACITRDRAKAIMWDGKTGLKRLAEMAGLGLGKEHFNESDLTVRLPNGSRIRLFGADATGAEQDKVLGDAFRLVIIDEAASFRRDLRTLVYSKIRPAALDYGGTICLTGTPGDFIGPEGEGRHLFYAVTNGEEDGWSVHSWSTLDNPHMRDKWREELERIERTSPRFKQSAQYKIMYEGQWAIELSKLIYHYDDETNGVDEAPRCTDFVVACDLGSTDDTAFVVWGWRPHDPNLYGLHASKMPGLDFRQVANEIHHLRATFPGARLVIDGANKQGVDHMRKLYGLPSLINAEKTDKWTFMRMMDTDLLTGKVRIVRGACDPLITEWSGLIRDDKKTVPVELASCPNHCADAGLYGWRYALNYRAVPASQEPAKTAEQQMDELMERRNRRGDDDDY